MFPETISHFQLIQKLGEGGMGAVYLAQDLKLGRPVALKILPEQTRTDDDTVDRLIIEGRGASALNHPNVAHIYEAGEDDEISFIAMEFVEGERLDSVIKEGKLDEPRIVELGLQIADALEEAHEKGIVHRDIKP